MRYFIGSLLLVLANLLYSAYGIKVAKEYTRTVSQLKREKERALTLEAEIQKYVNYTTAKAYAESTGFKPIDWSRVRLFSPSGRE